MKFMIDTEARTVTPVGPTDTPHDALYVVNADDTLTLTKTGHVVRKARADIGENIIGYFSANAALLGSRPEIAGALGMGGAAPYDIGKTGDKAIDIPIQADAFANPEAYGLGEPGGASPPQPAFDVDIRTLNDADLRFFGAFYNELHGYLGPLANVQALSHFMDYGVSETNHKVDSLPGMAEWSLEDAKAIKAGQWDSNYHGPMRDLLSKHRGTTV